MTTDIFIVSCRKHLDYLKYSLRSLLKFASGFNKIVLMFPDKDAGELYAACSKEMDRLGVMVRLFEEWPEKGMLHHELLEMTADKYCPGDAILHWDSDYVATDFITPETFVTNYKPVMIYASYEWLCKQNPNLINWQRACEAALGWAPINEFMRRPGLCHVREVYPKAVAIVEDHTGMTIAEYIRSCQNSFPQTFAEYPLLGEVAWQYYPERYKWVQQGVDEFPHVPIQQFWSHGPMDNPQNIWVGGEHKLIVPRNFCEELGLGDHQLTTLKQ